jgi:hypothetical protein
MRHARDACHSAWKMDAQDEQGEGRALLPGNALKTSERDCAAVLLLRVLVLALALMTAAGGADMIHDIQTSLARSTMSLASAHARVL